MIESATAKPVYWDPTPNREPIRASKGPSVVKDIVDLVAAQNSILRETPKGIFAAYQKAADLGNK